MNKDKYIAGLKEDLSLYKMGYGYKIEYIRLLENELLRQDKELINEFNCFGLKEYLEKKQKQLINEQK